MPPRILVVDDEPLLLGLWRITLEEEADAVVVTAEDGADAIAWLDERFDLVITDLHMPRVNGLSVIQAVRQRWPATPVMLVTGRAASGLVLEAVLADVLLAKPFDLDEALATVRSLLRVKGARREIGGPSSLVTSESAGSGDLVPGVGPETAATRACKRLCLDRQETPC